SIHERQLAQYGGNEGIRNECVLTSVQVQSKKLAQGKSEIDMASLAANLVFGLVLNQPFVDGNKRTAHVAYRTLLALNGANFNAGQKDMQKTMLAIEDGKVDEDGFAAWLRKNITA